MHTVRAAKWIVMCCQQSLSGVNVWGVQWQNVSWQWAFLLNISLPYLMCISSCICRTGVKFTFGPCGHFFSALAYHFKGMSWCTMSTTVFWFVFNKLREADVWPASSRTIPGWSLWWIVVRTNVCVSYGTLKDLKCWGCIFLFFLNSLGVKLKQSLKKQWLILCVWNVCVCVCVASSFVLLMH